MVPSDFHLLQIGQVRIGPALSGEGNSAAISSSLMLLEFVLEDAEELQFCRHRALPQTCSDTAAQITKQLEHKQTAHYVKFAGRAGSATGKDREAHV